MNQITTQYVTENGACYEQYVITDPAAKTSLTITPERGGIPFKSTITAYRNTDIPVTYKRICTSIW